MNWKDCPVLVTGGASFISSHLIDKLVEFGASVTVVDDLSNGKKENLVNSWDKIKFIHQDLEYISKKEITDIFTGNEIVFILQLIMAGEAILILILQMFVQILL